MSKVIPFPAQSIRHEPELHELPSPWLLRIIALAINFGAWAGVGIVVWEIFRP